MVQRLPEGLSQRHPQPGGVPAALHQGGHRWTPGPQLQREQEGGTGARAGGAAGSEADVRPTPSPCLSSSPTATPPSSRSTLSAPSTRTATAPSTSGSSSARCRSPPAAASSRSSTGPLKCTTWTATGASRALRCWRSSRCGGRGIRASVGLLHPALPTQDPVSHCRPLG